MKQLITWLLTASIGLNAQCVVGTNQPPPRTNIDGTLAWRQDAAVTWAFQCGVPCYPASITQSSAAWTAFWNWQLNNGYNKNNSRVTFYAVSSVTSSDPQPWAQIVLTNLFPGAVGIAHVYWTNTPPWRLGSVVWAIERTITNWDYFAATMAHEIGHSMALADCPTCMAGSTVMVTGANSAQFNTPGDPLAPTDCDNAQVRQTAYP